MKLPVNVAGNLRGYAGSIVTDTLELFAPTQSPEEFVHTLVKEKPISDARCAMDAIRTARKLQRDAAFAAHPASNKEQGSSSVEKHKAADVLHNIGYALLKRAIIRAEEHEEIPDDTTQQLVFDALEVGADPSIKGFLGHQDVAVVTEVFDKHDNVTVFTRGK